MGDVRLYGKFTLDFPDSPKIMPLSDSAFRCLVEATLYSRRMLTDGFLAERFAVAKWGAEVLDELCSNDPERPSLRRVEGGFEIHDFAEHQSTAAEIAERREKRRAAGQKGARARWGDTSNGKSHGKRMANAMANAWQDDGTTNGKSWPETETETETVTSNEVTNSAIAELFEDAWRHWPKKVEKKAALAKFKRAAKQHPPEWLADQIIRFGTAYAATTEKQYTPGLAAWLNGERWTDELPAARTAGATAKVDQNLAEYQRLYGGGQHDGRAGSVPALDIGVGA